MHYFHIPENLWSEPHLAMMLAHCESRKPYQGGSFLHKGRVVKLKLDEIFIDVEDTVNRLKISKEDISAYLEKLKRLEQIHYREENGGVIVTFRYAFMHPQPTLRNEEQTDGEIEPVTFNDF